MTVSLDDQLQQIRRQLRLLAILSAAEDTGLVPVPASQLHVIAYFADALAPVWSLRIIDEQLLKRQSGPMSPLLQQDLDLLVGRGVVAAHSVRHIVDADGSWRLDANYELHQEFACPIIAKATGFSREVVHFDFVREVVYAIAGLGLLGITAAPASDAAYGDSLVDFGGLLDIGELPRYGNQTVRVARRFGELADDDVSLTGAEMVHLYVRELYNRLDHAA